MRKRDKERAKHQREFVNRGQMSHPAPVPHSSHAKGARDAVGVGSSHSMTTAETTGTKSSSWFDMSAQRGCESAMAPATCMTLLPTPTDSISCSTFSVSLPHLR